MAFPRGGGGGVGPDSVTGGDIDWPLLADDGSAPAPSYSFASDPDSGMYWASANNVGIAAAGSSVIWFGSSRVRVQGSRDFWPGSDLVGDIGDPSVRWGTGFVGGVAPESVNSSSANFTADALDRYIHLTHATPTLILPAASTGKLEYWARFDNAATVTPNGADTVENNAPNAGTWYMKSDGTSNWEMVQVA